MALQLADHCATMLRNTTKQQHQRDGRQMDHGSSIQRRVALNKY